MKVSYTLFALTHRFICRSVPALLHGSVTKQQRRKRRIMKKKVVSLLAAMALAVTALAGCGSNDAATPAQMRQLLQLLLRWQLLLKQQLMAKLSVV